MDMKGYRTPKDVILLVVRWYLRYKLSYRELEEMLLERGIHRDHTNLFRWVIRFTPLLEKEFRKRKKFCGDRWRMDETYIKISGQDRYLYRAVDKGGNTVDFLLTARRNRNAARRFLKKATKSQLEPSLINIDQSGANKAGIDDYNEEHGTDIEMRQCKYLNNIVEQDHRNIKGRIKSPLPIDLESIRNFWPALRFDCKIIRAALFEKYDFSWGLRTLLEFN